jgi:3-phenylpropionate/cinnamic acid dioxygenase small subunit
LQPGECVDGDQVGVDERAHLEDDHVVTARQQYSYALAELGDVGARDRPTDDFDDDRARLLSRLAPPTARRRKTHRSVTRTTVLPLSGDPELAIRNLLARLAHLADSGDVTEYVASMTEDVVWAMPANPSVGLPPTERRGRDDVAAGVHERLAAGLQGPGSNTRHVVTTTTVTVESNDRATAQSYFMFIDNTSTAPAIRSIGRYDDVLCRTADGWQLAARTISFG